MLARGSRRRGIALVVGVAIVLSAAAVAAEPAPEPLRVLAGRVTALPVVGELVLAVTGGGSPCLEAGRFRIPAAAPGAAVTRAVLAAAKATNTPVRLSVTGCAADGAGLVGSAWLAGEPPVPPASRGPEPGLPGAGDVSPAPASEATAAPGK